MIESGFPIPTGNYLDDRREVAEAPLKHRSRAAEHPPAGEIEAELETRELHCRSSDETCDAIIVSIRLEVVEAVVERRVAIQRPPRAEVGGDVPLDLHWVVHGRRSTKCSMSSGDTRSC